MNPTMTVMKTVWNFEAKNRGNGTMRIVVWRDPSSVNYTVGHAICLINTVILRIDKKKFNAFSV